MGITNLSLAMRLTLLRQEIQMCGNSAVALFGSVLSWDPGLSRSLTPSASTLPNVLPCLELLHPACHSRVAGGQAWDHELGGKKGKAPNVCIAGTQIFLGHSG